MHIFTWTYLFPEWIKMGWDNYTVLFYETGHMLNSYGKDISDFIA